jgi:ribosomal protein S24E
MEVEITTVKENPLMDRREVKAEVDHQGETTPSEEDVKSRIAAENGIETENIEINHIYTNYGSNNSEASLHVYEEFEYDENLEKEKVEEESEGETKQASKEYKKAVSGTITEAKETLSDMDEPDYKAALEAEKADKNRTTLVDWLESQIEG